MSIPLDSAARLRQARRIVVKIGSALLVEAGRLRTGFLAGLAADVAGMRAAGTDVVLVSSGSIALGRGLLGIDTGSLDAAQAAAAVGQIRLAQAYADALDPNGLTAAQVLVTLEDSADRRRYLNSRATLRTLLALGTVPIVNENDTVATDEIRFGDNDRLAAQVTALTGADMLVLLSDIDGLYTADPRRDPAARRLETVGAITPEIEAMAGGTGSAGAKGGMRTKILAARTAMAAGAAMAIVRGQDRPLTALAEGAPATWFLPSRDPATARKQWIAAQKPRGRLVVDAGAAAALARGKSLLAAGVTAVEGRFERGDAVDIVGPAGRLGVGLAGYGAEEARAIQGRSSRDIPAILGHPGRAALVHRDDMAD